MTLRRLRPLTGGVRLATGRRYRTTSTVILGPERDALLIDPAWTPDDLQGLAAARRCRTTRRSGTGSARRT